MSRLDPADPRNDWTRAEIAALFDLPFAELATSGNRLRIFPTFVTDVWGKPRAARI